MAKYAVIVSRGVSPRGEVVSEIDARLVMHALTHPSIQVDAASLIAAERALFGKDIVWSDVMEFRLI